MGNFFCFSVMLQEDLGSDLLFCSKTLWGLKCAPFTYREVASVSSQDEPALDRTAFEKPTTGTLYGRGPGVTRHREETSVIHLFGCMIYSPKMPATNGPARMVGQLCS